MIWEIFLSPINVVAALVSGVFLGRVRLVLPPEPAGASPCARWPTTSRRRWRSGINVRLVFALSWAIAGRCRRGHGGSSGEARSASDTQLALVGLKVFPAVILGGLDSVPGAVVGGLIIGAVESVAAGYVDPYVGGGTKDFLPMS